MQLIDYRNSPIFNIFGIWYDLNAEKIYQTMILANILAI